MAPLLYRSDDLTSGCRCRCVAVQVSFKMQPSQQEGAVAPASSNGGSVSNGGVCVVLLHGNGLGLLSMQPLAQHLCGSGDRVVGSVISVDLFGHGRSDSPPLPHSQSMMARVVHALLTSLQIIGGEHATDNNSCRTCCCA